MAPDLELAPGFLAGWEDSALLVERFDVMEIERLITAPAAVNAIRVMATDDPEYALVAAFSAAFWSRLPGRGRGPANDVLAYFRGVETRLELDSPPGWKDRRRRR